MRTEYPYTVPADRAFMGKGRTYSAQTEFRQQAVRLRAIVDNPRDPAEAGAIGRDWAVDDPAAIIEEGSNANGSYTLYAGGKIEMFWIGSVAGSNVGSKTFIYPIYCKVPPNVRQPVVDQVTYNVTVFNVTPSSVSFDLDENGTYKFWDAFGIWYNA